MGESLSPSVRAQLDQAQSDPAIQAALEISLSGLRGAGSAGGPRRILFLTQGDACRRRLEVEGGGAERPQLFWIPSRRLFRAMKRHGWDERDFDLVRVHFDRSGGEIVSRLKEHRGRGPSFISPASPDVKYLAYRKILRIAEDARKVARRGAVENARLLLWMALGHLVRYTYVRKDLAIPARIRMAGDLGQDRGDELASLFVDATRGDGVATVLERVFDVLSRYEADYDWPAWNWESRPLRFGRGFDFEALVFSESDSWGWRLWDRWIARPAPVLPALREAEEHTPMDLKELKEALGRLARMLPGITGALLMGSRAHREGPLQVGPDSDLDLVLFTRGLYLKRFFLRIQRVCVDGIVISEKAAQIGMEKRAPMVVIGCGHSEILYDSRGLLARLQETAQDICRRPPPALAPNELAYAFAASQWTLERLEAAPHLGEAGMFFLLFEEFIRVVYLATRASGVWTTGEQRVLPALEGQSPEIAEVLGGFLRGEGASSCGRLRRILETLRESLGVKDPFCFAESRQELSGLRCFDL